MVRLEKEELERERDRLGIEGFGSGVGGKSTGGGRAGRMV